jgi:PKD repeat protein
MAVTMSCSPDAQCLALAGSPVGLMIIAVPPPLPPCLPPYPCPVPTEPGYQVQACDTVTWHFGDGSPDVTVTGQPSVAHTYAAPGTYQPTVTVTNTLGSAQPAQIFPVIVASNPTTYVQFSPFDVSVPETAGSVTFTLVRSGNLNTTAKVHCAHAEFASGPVNQGEAIGTDVTFNPGETTKTFTVKIYDDHRYTGTVSDYVSATATDGTQLYGGGGARYTLTEADPQPTATVADVRVDESTQTADVVVTFSAPIGAPVTLVGTPSDGTATYRSDYDGVSAACNVPPGDTRCVLSFPIVNDDVPEPDETFTVTVRTFSSVGPNITRDTATVTIVDDDAVTLVADPPAIALRAGSDANINLSVQPPRAAALTVTLSSTNAEVASVPPLLAIPADGSATLTIHALKSGVAKIWIVTPNGSAFSIDVTVADAPRRRRAAR